MSITLVAIQLLQRSGDEAGMRRAVNTRGVCWNSWSTPRWMRSLRKCHAEEWKGAKARDRSSVLVLRGQLYLKLKDNAAAQKDFEASYATLATAGAAEKLGEVAELNKDLPTAIREYARAFALGRWSKQQRDAAGSATENRECVAAGARI